VTSSNTGRARRWSRCAAAPLRRRSVVGGLTLTTLLTAMTLLGAAAPVAAQPPLDTPPSADGMPGAEFIGELIGWAKWLGLALCGLAFIYGAATWRGFGSTSSGRAVEGKGYVISGAVGAAVIGLVGFVIPMLYRAASG
jgi:hypothetical protein